MSSMKLLICLIYANIRKGLKEMIAGLRVIIGPVDTGSVVCNLAFHLPTFAHLSVSINRN